MLRLLLGVMILSRIAAGVEIGEMTLEERNQAFLDLDWKERATYKLPDSHSTLVLPSLHVALFDNDARQSLKLFGESSSDTIEAITYIEKKGEFTEPVIFESCLDGYVALDDWKELDPKELLENIKESTEIANKERKKMGFSPVHVIGWLTEPTLNRETNTVYWAFELERDGKPFVNSMALKLSRKGYEQLNWITDKETFVPLGGELGVMLNAHSFDPGDRYYDYAMGDRLADYGVAALVAASTGGKIAKAGGLLLLLKKIGGFIAGLSALFYKFKNFFKRKKA